MKRISDKRLAQKGGLMIEALAMLGLIAVVTPTMYKKSAERTLEVEDINTAQTMRSVMGAADSYVSSNYGELVQDMTSHGDTVRNLRINEDLGEYLPYGFNADRLYDFDGPQVRVIRNGNNLTSFVLFPAKEAGDDGLGQERTVRLATLIGANGGYVNGEQSARGIGGIWTLEGQNFTDVFGNGAINTNSIVTASSDAINNTNTEEDTDKFLYRTDGNGKWHNTMRADLYLGGFGDEGDDGYRSNPTNRNFSIRNVKRLIIGSNSVVGGADPEDQDAIDASESGSTYGLYVRDGTGNGIDSAFIYGTLEAANSNLLVEQNRLRAGVTTDAGGTNQYSFKVTPGELTFGSNEAAHFKVSSDGQIDNVGSIYLANGRPNADAEGNPAQWSEVKIGKLGEKEHVTRYLMFGKPDIPDQAGAGVLTLIDDYTMLIKGKKGDTYDTDFEDRIVINSEGTKGDGKNTFDAISYTENEEAPAPVFPVRVGSNMKVDGILSTAQLDVQKIRAATLEVGSENINDPVKWLRVDKDGIHGSKKNGDEDLAMFEVHQQTVGIGVGTPKSMSASSNDALDATEGTSARKTILGVHKENGIIGLSSQAIDLHTILDTAPITLSNLKLQQEIKGNELVISSKEANPSTRVAIKDTDFEVSKGNNIYFEVGASGNNFITENSSDKYRVAMHGNTVFTDEVSGYSDTANPERVRIAPTRVYMNVGSDINTNAVVNIKQASHPTDTSEAKKSRLKQIFTVDGNSDYNESVGTTDANNGGTVYIRKGMVEVNPVSPSIFSATEQTDKISKVNADQGYGVIKASRFVANNPNVNTDTTPPNKVPDFFGSSEYATYNGSGSTRYDTYMVNPAYTSVMHDIKLTTRGGARLSDILPDFINKGIYITSNTYLDNITSLHFTAANIGSIGSSSGDVIDLGTQNSWASPYLGFVPAPQCPPGYNRLITLAPQSFMMSQAGQMQRGAHGRGGNAYYVKNQVPDDTAFTHYNELIQTSSGAHTQQKFVDASVATDADVDVSGVVAGTAKTKDIKVVGTAGEETSPKFLVSFGDETVPLTIQQSTWLKTNVIPVDSGESYIGHTGSGDKYTRGWAALMGFVYDAATYQPVITKLGELGNTLIEYDSSAGSVYWNIFPVRRNTLEAYATTYCYFDRNGIMTPQFRNNSDNKDTHFGEYIDHYNALKDNNTGYEKNIGTKYRERLNDPTLKYDEVW